MVLVLVDVRIDDVKNMAKSSCASFPSQNDPNKRKCGCTCSLLPL